MDVFKGNTICIPHVESPGRPFFKVRKLWIGILHHRYAVQLFRFGPPVSVMGISTTRVHDFDIAKCNIGNHMPWQPDDSGRGNIPGQDLDRTFVLVSSIGLFVRYLDVHVLNSDIPYHSGTLTLTPPVPRPKIKDRKSTRL